MTMRARRTVLWVALLLLIGAWSTPARAEVSFDFFYSNLSPHGSWQVSARYGRVWQPSVYARGWNPYYDGHWVYADVGWTWVSDYDWGAIPYHYGTWVVDPVIGWVWVPGYVWAPAWVVFRTGPDYIGWAPVSPGFRVGVSASFGGGAGPFVFVSARDFVAPRVRTCVIPSSRTRVIINDTRVVNTLVVERNVVVNRGPDVRFVERASGRRVRMERIEDVSRVAPGRRVDRDQIAVETRAAQRGLRVSEPVSAPAQRPVRGDRPARTRGAEERSAGARSVAEPEGRQHPRSPRATGADPWSSGRPSHQRAPAPPTAQARPHGAGPGEPPAGSRHPERGKPHAPQHPEHEHDHP